MSRTSILPKRLQPMIATLTDAPFDDAEWVFEDKYDGFRMVAKIESGKVTLYSRNGKIISHSYLEVAQALERVKGDAVIDGELVALDPNGVSHFQLLQNALRSEAKLQYCAFDLMFHEGDDLRGVPLLQRKARLRAILPRHRLITLSRHRKKFGTRFFQEAERRGLEGIMAKRAESTYVSGTLAGLAEDQDLQTPGGRHCWVHIAEADAAFFWSARSCDSGEERLALHRSCRHGIQP